MSRRRLGLAVGSILFVSIVSCARALREPVTASVLAGSESPRSPAEVDDLLARASSRFARRSVIDAREASRLWLAAAAADPARIEGLLGAARAGVWLADHEREPAGRLEAATRAVDAAHLCVRSAPGTPACDYWLGAALGVQARERPATGLAAIPLLVESFRKAAASDPLYDEAGPDRALALVFLRAPGWPTGPGDPDRGLEHARRAVELRPDYPPNRMALAEALAATEDPEGARSEFQAAIRLARSLQAAGSPDAADWIRESESASARIP